MRHVTTSFGCLDAGHTKRRRRRRRRGVLKLNKKAFNEKWMKRRRLSVCLCAVPCQTAHLKILVRRRWWGVMWSFLMMDTHSTVFYFILLLLLRRHVGKSVVHWTLCWRLCMTDTHKNMWFKFKGKLRGGRQRPVGRKSSHRSEHAQKRASLAFLFIPPPPKSPCPVCVCACVEGTEGMRVWNA